MKKYFVLVDNGNGHYTLNAAFDTKEQAEDHAKRQAASMAKQGMLVEVVVSKAILKAKVPVPDITLVSIE